MTLGLAAETHGDTVRVKKTVMPFVAQSTFIFAADFSFWSCFPATCDNVVFDATGVGPQSAGEPALADGQIRVGFEHFYDSGTKPCNCWSYSAHAYRGTALFRTRDIPHHFKSATLVLTATASHASDPNAKTPFLAIFRQDVVPYPLAVGDVQFDPATGRTTATLRHLGQFALAPVDTDLGPPFTASKIVETGPFSFRLDVTAVANGWLQDWPNRNLAPLHGFTLVGVDESLPTQSNNALQATYAVTLEFDIDDPDF
ncbi:MAG TPA: hypothetical protein VH249_24520 [Xanthobacteraceae bacterium]|jgi:hypothetical protein|nr:hypothetical protein [Xanthobacteraceae bacterium]